jgi:hypothetical protein
MSLFAIQYDLILENEFEDRIQLQLPRNSVIKLLDIPVVMFRYDWNLGLPLLGFKPTLDVLLERALLENYLDSGQQESGGRRNFRLKKIMQLRLKL